VDDGDWQPAQLGPALSKDTWRQWTHTWTATDPGSHTLFVRAVDGSGAIQSNIPADPVPDGAQGIDSRRFTVT